MKLIKKLKTSDLTTIYFLGIPIIKSKKGNNMRLKKILFGLISSKRTNRHTKRKILGISVYCKKIGKNEPWKEDYCRSLIRAYEKYHMEFVASQYDFIVDSGDIFWKKTYNRMFAVVIDALICQDKRDKAAILLRRYISIFGYDWIGTMLRVMDFAYEQGYQNEIVIRGHTVFQQLMSNQKEKLLEKYLKGKTIAIVGNGGMELGKGKGKEIDAHDVVIRFNNYPSGYEKDYGSKTNIWCHGLGATANDIEYKDISKLDFEFCGLSAGIDTRFSEIIDTIWKNITKFPQKVVFLPHETAVELSNKYDLFFPTTGCLVIYTILNMIPDVKIDFYGFSFLYDSKDFGHFYDDKSRMAKHHFMDQETAFLKSLIKKRKEK